MSSPGHATVDELIDQVQSTLAIEAFDVASPWGRICVRANAAAYADIRQALTKRGYSQVQIDAWDDGPAFQADQGLFWALVRGGATKDYDPKLLMLLDRRKDLLTATITIDGEPVKPAGVTPTAVGRMNTADDLFSLSDDDMQPWYRAGEGPLVPPAVR